MFTKSRNVQKNHLMRRLKVLSPDYDRLPFHQVHQCLKDAYADFNSFMYIVIVVGIRISDGNIN